VSKEQACHRPSAPVRSPKSTPRPPWSAPSGWPDELLDDLKSGKATAEYPLPAPPQDPIMLLTGHGHEESTGSACVGGVSTTNLRAPAIRAMRLGWGDRRDERFDVVHDPLGHYRVVRPHIGVGTGCYETRRDGYWCAPLRRTVMLGALTSRWPPPCCPRTARCVQGGWRRRRCWVSLRSTGAFAPCVGCSARGDCGWRGDGTACDNCPFAARKSCTVLTVGPWTGRRSDATG
jgi:hypothetical protein